LCVKTPGCYNPFEWRAIEPECNNAFDVGRHGEYSVRSVLTSRNEVRGIVKGTINSVLLIIAR
jgi:hypothetical protein